MNLNASTAIDAMKETSGRNELTIKFGGRDGQLLISVSDTGVGLRQERRSRSSRLLLNGTPKEKKPENGDWYGAAHQSVDH